jgi:diguanylate cyclase (GGDEF)-like protein
MRIRPLGACAAASTVVVVAFLFLAPQISERLALSAWAQALAELGGAAACAVAAAHTRGRARLVWLLFAMAELIWAGTDATLAVMQLAGIPVPEVSVLDLVWLSFYVPAGLATMLIYRRMRPERGAQGPIDGLIVTIGVATLGWATSIGDLAPQSRGGLEGTLVVALYPALDLACAAALAWILVRHRSRTPAWFRWVVAAFVMQMTGGIGYLIWILPGAGSELLSATAYVAAGWCWIAAGTSRTRSQQRAWAAASRDRPPTWSETLPFLVGVGVVALAAMDPDPELRAAGVVVACLMAVRAIEALRVRGAMLDERDRLLVTDPLTGAYNRRFLVEETDRAFARARRGQEPLAAIALDLDRFKEVNDQLGHVTGDRLLQAVCTEIGRHLRASDVLFRLGGDEFLILCAGTDGPGAVVVADRIRACALAVVPSFPVSASLGVSAFPADAADAGTLLRNADIALYEAKAGGRNVVHHFGSPREEVAADLS